MNEHGRFTCKSPQLKTAQKSFSGWKVKQMMVHAYWGMLLSKKKEWAIFIQQSVDESQENYVE